MNKPPLLWGSLRAVARVLTTLLFDLKVYGQRWIPLHDGVLIVSNHQGYLDPVVLGVGSGRPMSYLAKSELFEVNPLCTWLLRSLGAIPVRQGAGDIGALRQTIHRLQNGHVLNIYPEGSRSEDGEIGRLERGVALVIRRANVPVVPAVIVGSFQAWPIQRRLFRTGPVRVQYGPPMDLAGLDTEQIMATLDQTLRSMFEQLRNNGNGHAAHGNGHPAHANGKRPRSPQTRPTVRHDHQP